MNAKKLLSVVATAAATAALWLAPNAPTAQAQQCAPGYLIAVPGGANTVDGIPASLPHGGNVFSTGLLVQAQSASRVQPMWVSYRSDPFLAERYPDSRTNGYNRARQMIMDLAAGCPQSRFSFTGYSLGADIVSHLVNDIASGRGPIAAEQVGAVALFANPYQGANGAVPASITNPVSRGALGGLPGGFGELGGRVLEFCYADDLVCSTPEQYRGLVGPAMEANMIAGEVPAVLGGMLSSLGVEIPGVFSGIGAHGRYNLANHREAADWIVSRT